MRLRVLVRRHRAGTRRWWPTPIDTFVQENAAQAREHERCRRASTNAGGAAAAAAAAAAPAAASSAAAIPPLSATQAAASTPSPAPPVAATNVVPAASIDWRAALADAWTRDQARLWACHTKTPAEERPEARRQPKPLMKSWLNAGGTAAEPASVNSLTVQTWDSELGSNDNPYTRFHVLARNNRDTVVGRSEQGSVYLRVLPTRWLPRDTFDALENAAKADRGRILPKKYEAQSFTPMAYERPAVGGVGTQEEAALLITDGPLKGRACNEVSDNCMALC